MKILFYHTSLSSKFTIGAAEILTKYQHCTGPEVLSDLVWETLAFSANGEADDDLSAVLVEFLG